MLAEGDRGHIDVTPLWVQEKVAKEQIEVIKVAGIHNLADILTKHVDREILQRMLYRCGYRIMTGRREIMPMLS